MSTGKQPDADVIRQKHIQVTKRAWRRWAKQTRQKLPLVERSAAVCDMLVGSILIHEATHILAYLPTTLELDITPLLRGLQQQSKYIYVTRTWTEHRQLSVHELDMTRLEWHPFGYLQPPVSAAVVDPRTIDLMLLPGLCFDVLGGRLGYGMGHIDRLLATNLPACKVGVVARELVVQRLPQETTDVRMDALVTDQKIVITKN
jgi:5-formyltetrahydrofolate cyclo-ligase